MTEYRDIDDRDGLVRFEPPDVDIEALFYTDPDPYDPPPPPDDEVWPDDTDYELDED